MKVEFRAMARDICEVLSMKIILGDLKIEWKNSIR